MRRSAATGPLRRRVSPALRGIAIAATLGLILAEAATLHHKATGAGHGDDENAVEFAAGDARAHDRAQMFAYDVRTGGDLAHDPCQLCQTSRDRFSALATHVRWVTGPADSSAEPPPELGQTAPGAAIYAVAPKTSPPA